jgi:hypothetical protein
MNINPPLGYGPIIALGKKMRVREERTLPPFAARINVIPVSVTEISLASHDYPVMFVKLTDVEQYVMVTVVGWTNQENLFVHNGMWEADVYVPAYVRRYPYCMTRIPAAAGQPVQLLVCIEESHIDSNGVVLFDEQGTATPRFNEIYTFLNDYEMDLERTREICSILADFKLFEPASMQATLSNTNFSITGLYRVDEKRLDLLNANQMKTLLRKGGLATIFQHLSSMTRFNRLMQKKVDLLAASAKSDAPATA